MGNKFEMLFQPIQIGPLRLKNRMVMSPMLTGMSSANGEVTEQLIDHYAFAAKGGLAMIIVEITAIADRYAFPDSQLRIDDRKLMRGLHRLVEAIHLNGSACQFQLHCAGAFGRDPISPSGVACYGLGRETYVQPRVLTLSEVEEVRDLFINAAIRAKELECDGVVLHGATSYLLQQWVSPHTNKRTDRYGGSFENRIQLPLEIVRGIRQKCGPSFPIGYSMVMDELLPDGISIEESTNFAKELEREGVNHIDLNIGTYETSSLEKGIGRSHRQPKGTFDKTEIFKKLVNIKVFARCNGEHDPIKWEEALQKGQCDVIQIGRPLLCDPELPKKIKEDRYHDIRLCIRCAQCFETSTIKPFQVACSLNPELGREREYAIGCISSHPKRVLVIGGGPGGLEAARVAAIRGHEVTLMEKEAELGGNARIASLPIGKEEIKTYFIDWLERQCRKAGVRLELNKEVSVKVIKQFNPDVVILATGAKPFIPDIPGIDKSHVATAEDVLTGRLKVGKKVVVAGGGQVGVETADFIAEKSLAESVTIIEMLPMLAYDMPTMTRTYMLKVLLPKWGVKALTNMQLQEITDDGIVALDKEWKRHKFESDMVVNALGYVPNITLSEALSGEVREFYTIGDCVRPRNILHAVREAAYIARQI
jgi:2,4-dienoyl-CoA reductase-like NADH-dependent reductase (Old Yellow Enzyme family)/NADPH-dependent 2,4-dienoyl-CoA reductase/sulfur reductase-like enzyme